MLLHCRVEVASDLIKTASGLILVQNTVLVSGQIYHVVILFNNVQRFTSKALSSCVFSPYLCLGTNT